MTKIFKVKEVETQIKVYRANSEDRTQYPMKTIRKQVTLVGKTLTAKLVKGEWVSLENGLKMKLSSHSHKSTYEGMVSPLMINLELEYQGKKEEKYLYIDPKDTFEHHWHWQGFVFIYRDHEYGKSQTFEVSFFADKEAVAKHLP